MSSPICEYRLTVHVFGATSSPSVANFALRETVKDNPSYGNDVKNSVLRNFYVDDYLCCTDNVEQATELVISVTELVSKGGFEITGFVSNSEELLNNLSEMGFAKDVREVNFTQDQTNLVLGLKWNVREDTLKYKITHTDKGLTRRGILATIHGIYDPLGLSGPAVIPAKKIFQDTCKLLQLGWDDALPPQILSAWLKFLKDLPLLERYQIPRCCIPEVTENIELHFFSHGSDTAYGSIAFARFPLKNGSFHCAPLLAKARLTPLHNSSFQTIPRIELNGAKLSVILEQTLKEELDYKISSSYFWTDSKTVLKYIANDVKQQDRFVSNRVSFIRCNTEVSQWFYVPSNENPADCISRGMSVPQYLDTSIWSEGPKFLWSERKFWPKQELERNNCATVESKFCREVCSLATIDKDARNPTEEFLSYSSGWYKTKRKIAWLNRFISFLKNKNECNRYALSAKELETAENCLIKYLQKNSFGETISFGRKDKPLPRNNPLIKYNPFIDEKGILRIGGRLKNSYLESKTINPIILHGKNKLTEDLITETHKLHGHMGRETIMSAIRSKYWIVSLNSVIKRILFNYTTCRRLNGQPSLQKMAPLPSDRLASDEPAFTRAGTDFFGPFEVKNGRKLEKRYGVIFTCLSSRAMHLEMAYSLSTDSFLNAFRRFVARKNDSLG